MRLYNSRLVSIQAWNEYVEPQSIYSKIRVALEKALGYYVSSLKSIGDGTPLTTTTQFKADSEKTNRFFKITEKMHQDRISGKLDIHRATHLLQLMGGVFLRKDMIDTTARLAHSAASHQLGNIGRVLYDNPFLNPYSLLEYLETLRSMYRLEGGELVEIDNPTPSLFTIGAGPDSLMGVFETMGKSSQYEMTRCFLAAKTIKHHFHTEKGYLLEVRIVEEVIRYIKKHCESMAWDISLSEIWQWSQEINAIFSGADAYSGRNQDTNVREYAIGKFYLDVVDKIIENKPDEGKELFRFSLSALKNKYSQPTMINKLIEHYKKQCEYKNWAISSKELDLIYREIIELFDDPNDIPDKIFEKFYKEIAHELFKKKINNNKREKFLDVSFRHLNSTASAEHLKWLYGDLELYIHKNSISQTGKVDSENTLKLAIQGFLSRIKQVIQHSNETGKNQLIKSVKEALKSISEEDFIELNLRH
jgi:hypothetical protein